MILDPLVQHGQVERSVALSRSLFAFIALLVGLLAAGNASPVAASETLQREEGRLPNGVRYLIVADRSVLNQVEAVLSVNAGNVDDPPGRNNLAHVVEHLVINYGTDDNGQSGYRFDISAGWGPDKKSVGVGGASTGSYRTNYDYNVHKDYVDSALRQLRQVAQGQQFDQSAVAKSIMDVLGETTNVTNGETGARLEFGGRFFSGNPTLQQRVSGARSITLADAKKFYERYYHAGNILLVVSGDLDIEETKRQIAMIFSDIRPGIPTTEVGRVSPPRRIELFSASYFDRPIAYVEIPTPGAFADRANVKALAARILRKRFEQAKGKGADMIGPHASNLIFDAKVAGQEIFVEAKRDQILDRVAAVITVLQTLKSDPSEAEMKEAAEAERMSTDRSSLAAIRREFLRRESPRRIDEEYYGDIDIEMPSARDVGLFLQQSLERENLKLFLAQGVGEAAITEAEAKTVFDGRAPKPAAFGTNAVSRFLAFGKRNATDRQIFAEPGRGRFEGDFGAGKPIYLDIPLENSLGGNADDYRYAAKFKQYLNTMELPRSSDCGGRPARFMVFFEFGPGKTTLSFRSINPDRELLWKNVIKFFDRCTIDVGKMVAEIAKAPWQYGDGAETLLFNAIQDPAMGPQLRSSGEKGVDPYRLWARLFGNVLQERKSSSAAGEAIYRDFRTERVIIPRNAPFGSLVGLTYVGKFDLARPHNLSSFDGSYGEIANKLNRIVHVRARHDHGGVYHLSTRLIVNEKLGIFSLRFRTSVAPEYVDHAIVAIHEELSRLKVEVGRTPEDQSPFHTDRAATYIEPAKGVTAGKGQDSAEHAHRRYLAAKALFEGIDLSRRREIVMASPE